MMIVCTKCQKFFHPEKNGVYIEELMPINTRSSRSEWEWKSYKLWTGDALVCRSCGHEIIAGFALRPLSEHYKQDYAAWLERVGPLRARVDDCP
jgi:hypothetical protein